MATLPTTPVPLWATSSSAEIVNPSDKKIAIGWESAKDQNGKALPYGEAPPYQWFNYVMNNYGQWINYLNDLTNETIQKNADITSGSITGIKAVFSDFTFDFQDRSLSLLHRIEMPKLVEGAIAYHTKSTTGFTYDPVSGGITINNTGILTLKLELFLPQLFNGVQYQFISASQNTLDPHSPYNSLNLYTGFTLNGVSYVDNRPEGAGFLDTVDLELSYSIGNTLPIPTEIFHRNTSKYCFYVPVQQGDVIYIRPVVLGQNPAHNGRYVTTTFTKVKVQDDFLKYNVLLSLQF